MNKKQTLPEYIKSAVFVARIGNIDFNILPDQSYWIENADGEGTQVSEQKLEEEMQDLFDRIM